MGLLGRRSVDSEDECFLKVCMDQDAFRSFYHKTAPGLRAYIARSCGSIDRADDFLQEVFMRFLMKAPKNLSEAGMRGYLYRTADSLIIDQWRRSKREHARDMEAAEQPPPPTGPLHLSSPSAALFTSRWTNEFQIHLTWKSSSRSTRIVPMMLTGLSEPWPPLGNIRSRLTISTSRGWSGN